MTDTLVIKENIVRRFLSQMLVKYANLSVSELEELVYASKPMLEFKRISKYKTGPAPYILNDCIKVKEFSDDPVVKGRRIYLKHIIKYPHVNLDIQKKYIKELEGFRKLAAWPKEDENGYYVGPTTPGMVSETG